MRQSTATVAVVAIVLPLIRFVLMFYSTLLRMALRCRTFVYARWQQQAFVVHRSACLFSVSICCVAGRVTRIYAGLLHIHHHYHNHYCRFCWDGIAIPGSQCQMRPIIDKCAIRGAYNLQFHEMPPDLGAEWEVMRIYTWLSFLGCEARFMRKIFIRGEIYQGVDDVVLAIADGWQLHARMIYDNSSILIIRFGWFIWVVCMR